MPEPADLPHLLRLLDDDNPVVQEGVRCALEGFGSGLVEAIESRGIPMRDEQWTSLDAFGLGTAEERFRMDWARWLERLAGDADITREALLEQALGMLSWQISSDPRAPDRIAQRLDRIADRYRAALESSAESSDELTLARYLFGTTGFRGDSQDYYSPANSDLMSVLSRRLGNPISLGTLYILIGARCGLAIAGCNSPGHFLTAVGEGSARLFIDCFNGGRVLTKADLDQGDAGPGWPSDEAADVGMIVLRILSNIANAYGRRGESDRVAHFDSLADDLR